MGFLFRKKCKVTVVLRKISVFYLMFNIFMVPGSFFCLDPDRYQSYVTNLFYIRDQDRIK